MRTILLLLLFLSATAHAQDASTYYATANQQFESRMYIHAAETIGKAIELDPASVDYRWLRVRSSMTHSAKEPQLKTAINDLNVILASDKSERTYAALGKAHFELAQIYNHEHQDYALGEKHYTNAKAAYANAKTASGNPDYDYDIRDAENYLKELTAKK
ncbi:MAG: hypothetical protein ITG00_04525 [Flavobacterium sp.]|nr:hypothetical protein [Flavobacterium sp.]